MAFIAISKFTKGQTGRVLTAIGVGVGALAVGLTMKAVQARRKDSACEGRGFPAMADYPDLRNHNNLMAKHLTPRLYSKLRDRAEKGVCHAG